MIEVVGLRCKRDVRAMLSSRLPDLPPGCEFRRTDSIAGEIAFMQADEFGFGQLGETPAAAGIDFFLRPSGYSCCCILPTHPRQDEVGDKFAKLFAVAKTEGIGFPE